MDASDIPVKFPIPFANNAGGSYIRAVPQASQIGIQAGAASLFDGFPPVCFVPVASGGVPPFGEDVNGIYNQITAWNQWAQAGGPVSYDAAFASSIGGYPKNALLTSGVYDATFWISRTDDNATNPDTPGQTGWLQFTPLWTTAQQAGNITLTLYDFSATYVSQGSAFTATLPSCAAVPDGYYVGLVSQNGIATFQAVGTDTIGLGTPGGTLVVPAGGSVVLVNDNTGSNWVIKIFSSGTNQTPQRIATNASLLPGLYWLDTRAIVITVALPASPADGAYFKFEDVVASWGKNPPTVNPGGKTVMGIAGNLVLNEPGSGPQMWYDIANNDWRLF